MEFKKFSAGYKTYGGNATSKERESVVYKEGVTNVNFYDEEFTADWNDPNSENYEYLIKYVHLLAVCQTIIV